jgi:hypothetical protein
MLKLFSLIKVGFITFITFTSEKSSKKKSSSSVRFVSKFCHEKV